MQAPIDPHAGGFTPADYATILAPDGTPLLETPNPLPEYWCVHREGAPFCDDCRKRLRKWGIAR